jgi:tetratricopeptide (TPR) repeat protein
LLNTNTTKIFGAQQDGYDVATEVVRWEVPTQRTDHFYESFTIDLDIVNNDVECYLRWENTQVHFSIATHNNALALQNIETHLAANPTDADNLAYAAYYLRMNNQEPQRLLGYVDRALQIKEDAWFYELKMNLLAEAGRVAEARTVYEAAIGYLRKARPAHWQDTERHLKHLTEQWK